MLATPIETPAASDGSLRPAEMGGLLERFPRLKLLSLDCFDTLLWRHVAEPFDVFYALQSHPAFAALGLDGRNRRRAEQMARQIAQVRKGEPEVTLAEIYAAAVPGLDAATIAVLEDVELEAELRACYAHPDAVRLLRAARQRGIETMIVSDTYFTEAQLRRLLTAHLPDDAYAAIHRVVVSSAHGVPKAGGLFARLVDRLGLPVRQMLHVGDNPIADVRAPREAGIPALHLQHVPDAVVRQRNYQTAAMQLLAPDVRNRRPLFAPYHGVQAATVGDADIARMLGHTSLGPMLHAFAHWLIDGKRALEAAGKPVKLAFLLRDGYMPWRACEAIAGEPIGRPIYLSRFASFAASFRTTDDVDRYLALFLASGQFEAMLKQLQLSGATAERILGKVAKAATPIEEFNHQLHRMEVMQEILARSSAYRARLRRYLQQELALEDGDTLVFVDLGYIGTAQRVLAPLMRQDWGVDLHGWYFMCTSEPGGDGRRRGLIDPSRYDAGAIDALLPFVSLLENLCTAVGGSVEDYDEDGHPIIGESRVKRLQSERVEAIQRHALEFVAAAERHFAGLSRRPDTEMLRDAALAEFGRMVYFPDRPELQHYKEFALELNLGTDRTIRLHDARQSLADLRRHGIFYTMRHGENGRINTPHELRLAGVELSLAMLATYRFGLSFMREDWSLREEPFTVLLLHGEKSVRQELAAKYTHDGCYRLVVPLGDGRFDMGIVPAETQRMFQLIEARVVEIRDLAGAAGAGDGVDISGHLVLDGLEHVGEGVLRRCGPTALILLPGGTVSGSARLALDLVVRPLDLGEG